MSRRFRGGSATATLSDADGRMVTLPIDPGSLMVRPVDGNDWSPALMEVDLRGAMSDAADAIRYASLSQRMTGRSARVVWYDEPAAPEHAMGAPVCAPGHRYLLTVVAYGTVGAPQGGSLQWPAYTLEDQRDPSTQPFPVVRVQAGAVKSYRWDRLLEMSDYGLFSRRQLQNRAQYLDACAHLHDLGDHDNADELLNEAAQRWWGACAVWQGVSCRACSKDGRHPRITNVKRLVLVECLIAAGLPEAKPSAVPRQDPGPGWNPAAWPLLTDLMRAVEAAERMEIPLPWSISMGPTQLAALRMELRAQPALVEAPPAHGGQFSLWGVEFFVADHSTDFWHIGPIRAAAV